MWPFTHCGSTEVLENNECGNSQRSQVFEATIWILGLGAPAAQRGTHRARPTRPREASGARIMATGGNTVRLTDRADTYTTKTGDEYVYALGGDDKITFGGFYWPDDEEYGHLEVPAAAGTTASSAGPATAAR